MRIPLVNQRLLLSGDTANPTTASLATAALAVVTPRSAGSQPATPGDQPTSRNRATTTPK